MYNRKDIGKIVIIENKPVIVMDDSDSHCKHCLFVEYPHNRHCGGCEKCCISHNIWFKELQTDFPELEGNQVVLSKWYRGPTVLYVAACNYHIGITLLEMDGTERYCVNKKIMLSNMTEQQYAEDFYHTIQSIKDASIVNNSCPNDRPNSLGNFAGCAFK